MMNEIKNWFVENINKIDKPLDLPREKRENSST